MRTAHSEAVVSLICYHVHITVDSGDKHSLQNVWRTVYAACTKTEWGHFLPTDGAISRNNLPVWKTCSKDNTVLISKLNRPHCFNTVS